MDAELNDNLHYDVGIVIFKKCEVWLEMACCADGILRCSDMLENNFLKAL